MKQLTDINDDLYLVLACRVYLYKSFYTFFTKGLNAIDIDFFKSEEFESAFYISEKVYNNLDYYNFVMTIVNKFTNSEFNDSLKDEYTRLMIGPGKLVAPPWEGVYRKNEDVLFTEYTLEVRQEYLKYNLLPKEYPHESDDHISLELNYMLKLAGFLCKNTADLQIVNNSIVFLENHLLEWIELYANKLCDAESIYIKHIANYLSKFLIADKIFLERYSKEYR